MAPQFERVKVLGVPVDLVREEQVLQFIRNSVAQKDQAQIVTINAEYVMAARRDPEFLGILSAADLATPDGAGVVWALSRRGHAISERVGGSDLIWSVSEQAAKYGHRVFLLGAAPGIAQAAAKVLCETYSGLNIVGAHSGSPHATDRQHTVDLIRSMRTEILFVAFGAPQQDMWITNNIEEAGVNAALGVGGSFDYVAGKSRRAPLWMRKHGLEWSWRLIREPWRWRRMLVLPQFVWLIWTQERINT